MRGPIKKDESERKARFLLGTEEQAVLAKEVITAFLGLVMSS